MKNAKTKLIQFSLIVFALLIVSLGTIKMFEGIELQTLKTKNTIVHSILNLFEQPSIGLTVPRAKAEEPKQLTTEEQYWYALKNDVGFRAYIVNMIVPNNNPGNLRFANQPNATAGGAFAYFPDTITGFRALLMQLEVDKGRGDTITTLIEDYAPRKENNTDKYIQDVVNEIEKPADTLLSDLDIIHLATIITSLEHSIFY